MAQTNWAGNYTYRARAIHAPSTLEQLQELINALPRVRVLGSRHSFTDIADSDELVTLERMAREVVVDRDALKVSLSGAVRYGELVQELSRERLALANLASLPHIAVAGAVSTATHGSGDHNGNLATAVAGLELAHGRVVTHSLRSAKSRPAHAPATESRQPGKPEQQPAVARSAGNPAWSAPASWTLSTRRTGSEGTNRRAAGRAWRSPCVPRFSDRAGSHDDSR
jgi:FAD/FMN-containing dehydrogenase